MNLTKPFKCVNYRIDEPNNEVLSLHCDDHLADLGLSGKDIRHILNELIGNFKNISLILRHLSLPNNYLTRVPPEIRLFPNLRLLDFRNNRIKEDDFKFYNSITRIRINREDPVFLDLGDNLINYIEAGAFEGKNICATIVAIITYY